MGPSLRRPSTASSSEDVCIDRSSRYIDSIYRRDVTVHRSVSGASVVQGAVVAAAGPSGGPQRAGKANLPRWGDERPPAEGSDERPSNLPRTRFQSSSTSRYGTLEGVCFVNKLI